MKPFLQKLYYSLQLSLLFLVSITVANSQIHYVNINATGNNDGSTWEDAFTNLNSALQTPSDQIWVAKGLYHPDNGSKDTTMSFVISTPIKIYGGFAGTETNIDQRDINTNPTILSGDLNQDDLAEDLTRNRADNSTNVFYIDSLIDGSILFDGLEITGGSTNSVNNGNSELLWKGAGIFSYSPIQMKDCKVYGNFSRSGGGIYVSYNNNPSQELQFENVEFYNNQATAQGACLFIYNINNILIENCTFSDNNTVRGAFYPQECSNITINNSTFERNINKTNDVSGGAIFVWQCTNIKVNQSSFNENSAFNGGAIFSNCETISPGTNNLTFDNCMFNDNEGSDWGGGAIYNWQSEYSFNECTFSNNSAVNSGGAFFSNAANKTITISNTNFIGNTAMFGASHTAYGENANYNLYGNLYRENIASVSGGGTIIGFQSSASIDSCSFEGNEAEYGGAIYIQNDLTNVAISQSEFKTNRAFQNLGGAINASEGVSLSIDQSLFSSNIATIGGAISSFKNRNPMKISNTVFEFNNSLQQGGAINLFDNFGEFTSCLFKSNLNNGVGGGAISNNASDTSRSEVLLINSTFYDNSSSIGSSISQFQTNDSSVAMVTLQNNIFSDEENNYDVESGDPIVISRGGNISNDNSFGSSLTNTNDKNSITSEMFVDPENDDFTPTVGGGAIDNGISNGAPSEDILGNSRVGQIDAGAYENQRTSTNNIPYKLNVEQIKIQPNLVEDYTELTIDNEWRGSMNISIYDMKGTNVFSNNVKKTTQVFKQIIDLNNLQNKGVYMISVNNGSHSLNECIVKI